MPCEVTDGCKVKSAKPAGLVTEEQFSESMFRDKEYALKVKSSLDREEAATVLPEGKYKFVVMFMDSASKLCVEWTKHHRQASGDEREVVSMAEFYRVFAVIFSPTPL